MLHSVYINIWIGMPNFLGNHIFALGRLQITLLALLGQQILWVV